jgi:chromosomal replication initiator protein
VNALLPPTPSQLAAKERREKFHRTIEQAAASLAASKAAAQADNIREAVENLGEAVGILAEMSGAAAGVFVPELATRAAETASAGYPSIAYLQMVVAGYYNIRVIDLRSARRTANIIMPRQVAMWFSKQLTPLSLPVIGRLFGGRDHTTVLHAARKIDRLLPKDVNLAIDIATLSEMITGTAQ